MNLAESLRADRIKRLHDRLLELSTTRRNADVSLVVAHSPADLTPFLPSWVTEVDRGELSDDIWDARRRELWQVVAEASGVSSPEAAGKLTCVANQLAAWDWASGDSIGGLDEKAFSQIATECCTEFRSFVPDCPLDLRYLQTLIRGAALTHRRVVDQFLGFESLWISFLVRFVRFQVFDASFYDALSFGSFKTFPFGFFDGKRHTMPFSVRRFSPDIFSTSAFAIEEIVAGRVPGIEPRAINGHDEVGGEINELGTLAKVAQVDIAKVLKAVEILKARGPTKGPELAGLAGIGGETFSRYAKFLKNHCMVENERGKGYFVRGFPQSDPGAT